MLGHPGSYSERGLRRTAPTGQSDRSSGLQRLHRPDRTRAGPVLPYCLKGSPLVLHALPTAFANHNNARDVRF